MPTSRAPVRPHRTLPVLVTEPAICDGEVAPPEVGEIGRYWLLFAETPPDAADPSIVTVEVDVEALDDGVPLRQPAPSAAFPEDERWWEWRLFLRGDGWTATWYSRRPTVGRQRLTGRLFGDLAYATTGSATGRTDGTHDIQSLLPSLPTDKTFRSGREERSGGGLSPSSSTLEADMGRSTIRRSASGLSSPAQRLAPSVPQARHRWMITHSPAPRTVTEMGSIRPPQPAARSPGTRSTCLLVRQCGQWLRCAVPEACIGTSRPHPMQRNDVPCRAGASRWDGFGRCTRSVRLFLRDTERSYSCARCSSGNGGCANGFTAMRINSNWLSSSTTGHASRAPQAVQRWMSIHSPPRRTAIEIGCVRAPHVASGPGRCFPARQFGQCVRGAPAGVAAGTASPHRIHVNVERREMDVPLCNTRVLLCEINCAAMCAGHCRSREDLTSDRRSDGGCGSPVRALHEIVKELGGCPGHSSPLPSEFDRLSAGCSRRYSPRRERAIELLRARVGPFRIRLADKSVRASRGTVTRCRTTAEHTAQFNGARAGPARRAPDRRGRRRRCTGRRAGRARTPTATHRRHRLRGSRSAPRPPGGHAR